MDLETATAYTGKDSTTRLDWFLGTVTEPCMEKAETVRRPADIVLSLESKAVTPETYGRVIVTVNPPIFTVSPFL
jgi:hypothetical protein